MGIALEMLSFNDTDAPAAFTAMTNNTGNSNVIRNASANSKIYFLTAWGNATGQAINIRVRSPLLHDNQQGFRFHIQVDNPQPLFSPRPYVYLYPQDSLLVENQQITADVGTNVHMFSMLVYYQDLPGISANLVSPDYIDAKTITCMASENTLATGTTGDYSGEEAVTAEINQWKANTYYALLGYTTSVMVGSIGWRGVDSGNLRVGGPGNSTELWLTKDFFRWLSMQSGLPCIPVFNSANMASVLIDATQDEGGADNLVTQFWAQLRP